MHGGGLQEGFKADLRFVGCAVGHRADNHKRLLQAGAGLGDGGSFHFHRRHVGKTAADAYQLAFAVDKAVAADHQPAAHRGSLKSGGGLFGGGHQGFVAVKTRRHAGQLAVLVAESGYVGIVVGALAADNHIADFQAVGHAAGAAGVDYAVGIKAFDQQRGGDGGVYLADAA